MAETSLIKRPVQQPEKGFYRPNFSRPLSAETAEEAEYTILNSPEPQPQPQAEPEPKAQAPAEPNPTAEPEAKKAAPKSTAKRNQVAETIQILQERIDFLKAENNAREKERLKLWDKRCKIIGMDECEDEAEKMAKKNQANIKEMREIQERIEKLTQRQGMAGGISLGVVLLAVVMGLLIAGPVIWLLFASQRGELNQLVVSNPKTAVRQQLDSLTREGYRVVLKSQVPAGGNFKKRVENTRAILLADKPFKTENVLVGRDELLQIGNQSQPYELVANAQETTRFLYLELVNDKNNPLYMVGDLFSGWSGYVSLGLNHLWLAALALVYIVLVVVLFFKVSTMIENRQRQAKNNLATP